MEHIFTEKIKQILLKHFGKNAEAIFSTSLLIQYINEKTRSVTKGSKARSSFGSLYSIYTIVEDYLDQGFDKKDGYADYEGSKSSSLISRAHELPFGAKTQNHSFNNRTNHEFKKYFPSSGLQPILHKPESRRYWINENLLKFQVNAKAVNVASAVIEIVDEYVKMKQDSFQRFIQTCVDLKKIEHSKSSQIEEFILGLLATNVDARLFEIVSYSILKFFYHDQIIIWGYDIDKLNKEPLQLFKTGRTNANDGGIDFVMRPLGRFFQVTETLDFKKYFLDIDKIQRYPITFVIKSDDAVMDLMTKIEVNAMKAYAVKAIVERYMDCIEEIINIPSLRGRFIDTVKNGYLKEVLDEIILQSRVEFNYEELDTEDDTIENIFPNL